MTCWMKRWVPLVCAIMLHSIGMAHAQDNMNSRAKEDLNAFIKKVEESDTLFNQKKYAEATSALAAAHDLYQRAERRDSNVSSLKITIKPQTFSALRFYGYITGPDGSLRGEMSDTITETAAVLHNAAVVMWRDASILSNADKGPLSYAFSDPPMDELTEERLLSAAEELYGPIRRAELPVPDREWRDLVLAGRHAQLIIEHLLQKYPEWRSTKINWIGQPTGDEVLADIKKKLAEAEPEYQKLVADFEKAEPTGVATAINEEVATLNSALTDVKRNGWLDWFMARDLYLSKDYLTKRRQRFLYLYTAEGKPLPSDKLKPIEDKIAELKNAIDQNAPRWRFPTGKPHNADIETRVKNAIKSAFPGATILKTALDDTSWTIRKNDLGLPRYRTRDVLVLLKIPGQKWPWLILGPYEQDYAGGGTYNPAGTFNRYSQARIQTAQ